MIVNIPNAGSEGLNKDLSEHELPVNVWTDALNVRFLDGYASQFLGHGTIYGTPPVTPYHLAPVLIGEDRYWIYASLAKLYAVSLAGGVTHTDLTRSSGGDYSATANSWTSTVLGGIPVFNPGNTTDVPQSWDLNLANNFTALPNWPANTYCRAMRGYKSFLVAMNVNRGGSQLPFLVKWSHAAVPGAVPTSWDETDPTVLAGEVDLADGYDQIIDGLALRDAFMIYKEASVWRMSFTGGQQVFRFEKVLGTSGAMNRNCIAEIDGYHLVLTNHDIIVHDGVQSTSILDKQTRRWLFKTIDAQENGKAFVFKNPFFNEVFICFPTVGVLTPNKAVVWNYNDKTISIRDMPDVHCGAYGAVETGLDGVWSAETTTWDVSDDSWNTPDTVPALSRCLMGADSKLLLLDSGRTFDGTGPQAFIERVGLSLGAPETIKMVKGIRPRIIGANGTRIRVSVGSQDDPYAEPVYTSAEHVIGTTVRNHMFVSGRYIAVKFETIDSTEWRLDSYDIELETGGRW